MEEDMGACGSDGDDGMTRVTRDGWRSGFLYWVPSRRRLEPDDPFFVAGNIERELLAKQVALDLTQDERYQLQDMKTTKDDSVFCPIAGCSAQLDSLEGFEDHYRARHTASCSVRYRVFPTSRLLSIHVSEAHDSFFQAKVARGFPMYECLVVGCGMKLKSYKSRQQHLVDKHKFPTSFEFYKKVHPSKRQRQKNQRKQAGHWKEVTKDTGMDVDGTISKKFPYKHQAKQGAAKEKEGTAMEIEQKIDDLVSSVSKLSTSESSPSRITFGHRHAPGFAFVPRSIRQNKSQVSQSEDNG